MAQIPALLISTSAGIIVTRVASEEEGAHLGRDIGLQIMAQPKAIAIAAGLLALLAIVPGLPTRPVPDAGALILGAIAWRLLRTPAAAPDDGRGRRVRAPSVARRAARGGRRRGPATSPVLTPIAVEVSAELGARLGPAAGDAGRSRPRSCRGCASGCSPSSGCRCRRCGCAPGAGGPRRDGVRHPPQRGPARRAARSPRADWGAGGRAPRRRGADAAAPLRPRAVRPGGDAGAARRASSGRTRRWCARSSPS